MKKDQNKERDLFKETAKIYQSITRNSMDGFWIVDARYDAYCQLIGYSRKELLKMKISDIEVREKSHSIIMRLQRIMKSGSDRFFVQHRKKNGEIIDVEASANYAKTGYLYGSKTRGKYNLLSYKGGIWNFWTFLRCTLQTHWQKWVF